MLRHEVASPAIRPENSDGMCGATRLGVNEFRIGMISSPLVLVAACSGEFPSRETESERTQQNALLTDSCALPPVNLRSAGLFAVLAGSTVTNTGPSDVIGDLGVSM